MSSSVRTASVRSEPWPRIVETASAGGASAGTIGPNDEIGLGKRLEDVLELEEVEDFADVRDHAGEFQIAAVLADLADLADEDSPAGAGNVLHAGEVDDDVIALLAQQRLHAPLQLGAGRRVHVAGDAEHRDSTVLHRLLHIDVDSLHASSPCGWPGSAGDGAD